MTKQKVNKINSSSLKKSIANNATSKTKAINKIDNSKILNITTKNKQSHRKSHQNKTSDFESNLNQLKQRQSQSHQISKRSLLDNPLNSYDNNSKNTSKNKNISSSSTLMLKPSVMETLKRSNKVEEVNNLMNTLLSSESNYESSSSSSTSSSSFSSSIAASNTIVAAPAAILVIEPNIIESQHLKRNIYESLYDDDEGEDHDNSTYHSVKKSKYNFKPSILGSYGTLDDDI
jgi:hypothetical protein